MDIDAVASVDDKHVEDDIDAIFADLLEFYKKTPMRTAYLAFPLIRMVLGKKRIPGEQVLLILKDMEARHFIEILPRRGIRFLKRGVDR